jgi:hypothetical protein
VSSLATPAPDRYEFRGEHPWRPLSALWLALAISLSLIIILAGYVISSGTLRIAWQLAGINVALGALVLQVAASVAWTTRGYRAIRLRQHALLRDIALVCGTPTDLREASARTALNDPYPSSRVVVDKGTVHHLTSCSLVADKPIAVVGDAAVAGRPACRVCQP